MTWRAELDRKAVRSGNIASVGYDARTKTLEIEFKSGGVYQYAGVPEKRYGSLMKASAIGRFFIREIRPWYACLRIE
jgi:hypothetical protein